MRGLHQSRSPVSPIPVASLHPQPWTTNSDLLCHICVETCGSLRLLRVHRPTHHVNQRSDPKFTVRARHVQYSRPRHHRANDKHRVPKAFRASLDRFEPRSKITHLDTWPKIILFSSAIAASPSCSSWTASSLGISSSSKPRLYTAFPSASVSVFDSDSASDSSLSGVLWRHNGTTAGGTRNRASPPRHWRECLFFWQAAARAYLHLADVVDRVEHRGCQTAHRRSRPNYPS